MRQIQQNKGFTLVELIVSIAIFAIVAAAIIAFFRVAMGQYRTNSSEVNLQTESQLTWKRLESNILMANQGIYVPNDHQIDIYSYDESSQSGKYIKTSIYTKPNSDTNTIWYQSYRTDTLVDNDTSGGDTAMFTENTMDGEEQVFANLVTAFNIEVLDKNGNNCQVSGQKPAKVVAHIEYEASPTAISSDAEKRKYVSDNTLAMRNAIVASNVPGEIYANINESTSSGNGTEGAGGQGN